MTNLECRMIKTTFCSMHQQRGMKNFLFIIKKKSFVTLLFFFFFFLSVKPLDFEVLFYVIPEK